MAKPKTFHENLIDWKTMVDNLGPHLADMPQVAADAAALDALVARSQELENERLRCASRLRSVHQERREANRRGRELRNRVAGALRLAFGVTSPKLVQFGIKPRAEAIHRARLTEVEKARREAERAAARLNEVNAKAALAEEKYSSLLDPPVS